MLANLMSVAQCWKKRTIRNSHAKIIQFQITQLRLNPDMIWRQQIYTLFIRLPSIKIYASNTALVPRY